MGLLIGIGNLATSLQRRDAEGVAWCRAEFAGVDRVPAAHGLPPHREPEEQPPGPDDLWWSVSGLPYGFF